MQHLKRTGWVHHSVRDPETVSGHMYRMAMMSFLFGHEGSSVDKEKCVYACIQTFYIYYVFLYVCLYV